MDFPKKIDRDQTFSFATTGDIASGFVNALQISKNKIRVTLGLSHTSEWYWSCQVNNNKETNVQANKPYEKVLRPGSYHITIRAYDSNTHKLVAFEKKRLVVK